MDRLFKDQPILVTERLILRRLDIQDAEDYHVLSSDPEVCTYLKKGPHISMEETLQFLESASAKISSRTAYNWGIVNKASARIVGRVLLFGFDDENDSCEIGYVLSKEHWKKGIMTEAARTVLNFAFHKLGANRVIARCNEENRGSEKVMQKLGMQLEGVLREQLKWKDHYIHQKQYAIIKRDFEPECNDFEGGVPVAELFPNEIMNLPEADIPLQGLKAYLSQGDEHQVLFMQFDEAAEIPEHSHESQWCVVLEGEILITMNGETSLYRKGDRYYVPKGVVHSAKIAAGYADISFFHEKERYKSKQTGS
ncbi:GNAT family N-acetyltransferase [Gorillibacterium sp. CAU 1737]|uniref:GNAT family N-acetyltransferase n=1 Tax=Gorillibacterium sp. CAU 1737 TaxID=3140362 RepID=UPI00326121FE